MKPEIEMVAMGTKNSYQSSSPFECSMGYLMPILSL